MKIVEEIMIIMIMILLDEGRYMIQPSPPARVLLSHFSLLNFNSQSMYLPDLTATPHSANASHYDQNHQEEEDGSER